MAHQKLACPCRQELFAERINDRDNILHERVEVTREAMWITHHFRALRAHAERFFKHQVEGEMLTECGGRLYAPGSSLPKARLYSRQGNKLRNADPTPFSANVATLSTRRQNASHTPHTVTTGKGMRGEMVSVLTSWRCNSVMAHNTIYRFNNLKANVSY